MTTFADSLTSLVSGMGTERDKSSTVRYTMPRQDDQEVLAAYMGAWLPKRIIDQTAKDATRRWREWQGDADQISAIEAAEKRLGVRAKVENALRLAGIFGRAHIYIGTNDADLMKPLRPDAVKRGAIQFLNVLDRRYVAQGEINDDSMSKGFGKPKYYTTVSGAQVHPSRFVTFLGAERPDSWIYGEDGDSTLLAVMPAVKRHDSTVSNVASLVFEARVDVISIPGLADLLSDPDQYDAVMKRFALMSAMKGNNGMVLLNGSTTAGDPTETWDQKNQSFATLPDIITKAQEEVSAAAQMPRALLFGTASGGMGSTGDLELSSYYDSVNSEQSNVIEPRMHMLDECIIRDALGSRPDGLWYEWRSLWQMSDLERAELNLKNTDAMGKFIMALRDAPEYMHGPMINRITEDRLMPGLEAEYNEWLEGGGMDDNIENDGDLI